MSYKIVFHENRCIACGACAVACMDQKDLDKPLRRCYTQEEGSGDAVRMLYRSDGCNHCREAVCMWACPQECIDRDRETGFVVYDNEYCLGCGRCRTVCPEKAPVILRGKMHKCDGCVDRVKAGLLPACVRVCPLGALELVKE